MPTITGEISDYGAVICVLVGVPTLRRQVLQRLQMIVPSEITVRALIDTGSHVTGFSREVFTALELGPFGRTPLRTPSTRPGEPFYADQYEVSLSFVSGMDCYPFPTIRAIASDDFQRGDEVEAIIGRDILNRCNFQYLGFAGQFNLFF